MKAFLALALLFASLLFFGCATSTNPPGACTQEAKICPDGSAVGRQGPNCEFVQCPPANYTLYGTVVIGPLCPVEPCGQIFDYTRARVNVYSSPFNDILVARVTPDSSGAYWVNLEPGNYVVTVTGSGGQFGLPGSNHPQPVSIERGRAAELNFSIDTGIR